MSDLSTLNNISVDLDDDIERDPANDAAHIELADGSVTVNLGAPRRPQSDAKFFDNLAEHMSESDLNALGADLVRAIEEDDDSRSEWLEQRAEGLQMLGIKIEKPGDDMRSTARSTLLLEAVLRFQANASGELMPTDGPAKVRNDSQDIESSPANDLARALEEDLNHYLTVTATEYYPDTDRMLFMLGVGGCSFKKVYRCPIRRRPVSESVPAEDLIVSNAATDLANADRVTHQVKMRPRVLKRMQKLGAYRDIDLTSMADPTAENAVDKAKSNIAGVSQAQNRPEESDVILYECYCQLDLAGFEHEEDGEQSGIPLPYKVVVEKTSNTVLEIRRNYAEDDDMQQAKEVFVKFGFVPGIGFYDLGLHQIAGNPTMAATVLLRCAMDASIFANFPGMVHSKLAGRQETNILNIAPGTSVGIETNGLPIRDAIMPLPYKSPDGTILQLMQNQTESGARVAGVAEVQVGEGRQDAPVGTTIAMIEQATKVMDAVHKRLFRAQGREIQLIRDLFRENPEDFWRFGQKSKQQWTKDAFVAALQNNDFVPSADPNTASHLQRIMRAQALYMMATQAPQRFDLDEVQKEVLLTLNYNNPQRFMPKGPPPAAPPDPKDEAAATSAQADLIEAQAKQASVGIQAQKVQSDAQVQATKIQGDQQQARSELQRSALVHESEMEQERIESASQLAATREKAAADIASAHAQQDKDHAHDIVSKHVDAALAPKPSAGSRKEKS